MGQSTQLRDHTLAQANVGVGATPPLHWWKKIKRGLVRFVFWSYERGTWQYDVIVVAILGFIFLTPRSWFQDRPTLQLTDLRHNQGFVEVAHGKGSSSYIVDARLVEAQAPEKTEDAIREILHQRVKKPFIIKSVDTIRDRHNVVLGYTVVAVFQ